jgi:hypothetical protein
MSYGRPSCDERAIRACTKRSATVTRATGEPQGTASTTPTESSPWWSPDSHLSVRTLSCRFRLPEAQARLWWRITGTDTSSRRAARAAAVPRPLLFARTVTADRTADSRSGGGGPHARAVGLRTPLPWSRAPRAQRTLSRTRPPRCGHEFSMRRAVGSCCLTRPGVNRRRRHPPPGRPGRDLLRRDVHSGLRGAFEHGVRWRWPAWPPPRLDDLHHPAHAAASDDERGPSLTSRRPFGPFGRR